jgi:hypothetical protein
MIFIAVAILFGDSDNVIVPVGAILIASVLFVAGKIREVRHEETKADR